MTYNLTPKEIEFLQSLNINLEGVGKDELIKLLEDKMNELENRSKPLYETVTSEQIEANIVRCPDPETADKMIELIETVASEKDSVGGVIQGVIRNVPVGLGEPEFDKLPAELAKAMMSINATKGFEIGSGFKAASMRGSEHNDKILKSDKKIKNIALDFGGVLFQNVEQSITCYFQDIGYKNIANDYPVLKTRIKKETGFSSISYDFFGELSKVLDTEYSLKISQDNLYQQAVETDWLDFAIKTINKLSKNYNLYYLTNGSKELCNGRISQPEIQKYFKGGLSDAEIDFEFRKPDLEIYRILLNKFNLNVAETVFVDDQKENISSAQQIGLETILYNSKKDSLYKQIQNKVESIESQSKFETNHAGGVLGGISNGQTIHFRVAIKPVATIGQSQKTIDKEGNETEIEGKGRHDPCVLPRAVPIVESMAALVMMDMYLRSKPTSPQAARH